LVGEYLKNLFLDNSKSGWQVVTQVEIKKNPSFKYKLKRCQHSSVGILNVEY